jgi:hypothetical protein
MQVWDIFYLKQDINSEMRANVKRWNELWKKTNNEDPDYVQTALGPAIHVNIEWTVHCLLTCTSTPIDSSQL